LLVMGPVDPRERSRRRPRARAERGNRRRSVLVLLVGLARCPIGVGLARVLRPDGAPRHLGVRLAGAGQQLLHPPRLVGHDVGHERQRRRVPDARARPDLGAQHTGGAGERGGGARRVGLGVDRLAQHRVVDGGLAEVTGDPRVRDGHHRQPRVLHLVFEGLGHDVRDPLRQPLGACVIHHLDLLQSSGPSMRNRAESSSSSGRAATKRSQRSSTAVTWSWSAPTQPTPMSDRRCRSRWPASATATSNRRRSSATTGRTSDRFSFREWTSPSRTSNSNAPTYMVTCYARGFSRISKVSMTSPSLMSLKLPSVRPHSKPSRTSTTSSFSRRRDAIDRLSFTTTLSRIRRALALRRITPLITRQPAIDPKREDRKTWRTSARPSSISSNSGFSMPLSAASISSMAW